jgi:glycerol-3-phosphate acyltransferase PlsY
MTPWQFGLAIVTTIVICYLIGNINFAALISRLWKVNIRQVGSKNPGMGNVLRSIGVRAAVLTLVLDIFKAAIPAITAYTLFNHFGGGEYFGSPTGPAWWGYYIRGASKAPMYIAGLSVILGNILPAFYKFKGGKGVASTLGLIVAANPLLALSVFAAAFLYLLAHKYMSIASLFIVALCSTVTEAAFAFIYKDSIVTAVLAFAICALVFIAHWRNIRRLIKGEEKNSNLLRRFKGIVEKKRAKKAAEAGNAPAESETEK